MLETETIKPRIGAVGFYLHNVIGNQSDREGVAEQDRGEGQAAKGSEAALGDVGIVMNLGCDSIISQSSLNCALYCNLLFF